MTDCSSAEEERKVRHGKRSLSRGSASTTAAASGSQPAASGSQPNGVFVPPHPGDDYADLMMHHAYPDNGIPAMKSMSQLLADCVATNTNVDGSTRDASGDVVTNAASAATVGSTKKRKVIGAVHAIEPKYDLQLALSTAVESTKGAGDSGHWVKAEWDARIAQLQQPEFYNHELLGAQPNQNQITQLLRRQQLFLPVQSAELESQLLGEAGQFEHATSGKIVNFPPCRNGLTCVGMTQRVRNQPRPFILTMTLFEPEYRNLIELGMAATASRPCVMCSRYNLTLWVIYDRAVRMCGDATPGDSVLPVTRKVAAPMQYYHNLCEQKGGYHKPRAAPDDRPVGDRVAATTGAAAGSRPESAAFLRRSKTALEDRCADISIGCSVEHYLFPELVSLLNPAARLSSCLPVGLLARLVPGGKLIDRNACVVAMRDNALPPAHSWLAAQLLDAIRDIDDRESRVPITEARINTLCNELTLAASPLHVKAFDLSFFTSLSDVDLPLLYLLSKCINQRCQARKFAQVALRWITRHRGDTPQKQARAEAVAKQLQELVLCALLGNYVVSEASSRPRPQVRDMLYDLMRDNGTPGVSKTSRWLVALITHARALVMYCLREQVVFAVEEQPGVLAQVESLVQFRAYAAIVRSGMARLREYIDRMLSCDESSLYQDCYANQPNTRWAAEIAFLVKPFDDAILRVSYRRPKQSFREFVLSVSNQTDVDEARVAEQTGVEVAPINRLVSTPEIAGLRELAERLVDRRGNALSEMMQYFHLMGVHADVIVFARMLMEQHQQGTTPLQRLKFYLACMQAQLPRAFQLIQIAAELVEDTHRVRLLTRLSINRIFYQIEACQTRFAMRGTQEQRDHHGAGSVLDHLFYFVYCDVCFATYSLLADSRSAFKADYNFGLRDAVCDYQTGEMYCLRDRHTHRGSCSRQPLKRVFMLGNVLHVKGSIVQICGQERCGRMMVVNPECGINSRGRACCHCTNTNTQGIMSMRSLIAYYNTSDETRRCLFCEQPMLQSSKVYVYPMRAYVCSKHHSSALAQHTKHFLEREAADPEAQNETPQQKRASMEQFMREYIIARDAAKRSHRARLDVANSQRRK